jgi:NAD(P)-dependent dehydrogenase (short-subunit alcohol dehydrogenase family)
MSTTLPLRGKTALVTGSARGIGAAIAWKLATEGADVSGFCEQTDSSVWESHKYIDHNTPSE